MNRLYKRIVLFGVDGAGAFFREADTPNIDRIFKNGSRTYDGITALPSISAECWGSMLHGVDPSAHKMTNGSIQVKQAMSDSRYPSFFRVIRENYPDAVLASFTTWSAINRGIIENDIGVIKVNGDERTVTDKAVEFVSNNEFDLLFVMYEEVDLKGHHNGYGSQRHLEEITQSDRYIGEIYDALEKRGMVEDTLFIVSPDHGGTIYGNHGGDTKEEMQIMIAVAGKGVINGTMGGDEPVYVKSVAAIILYGMGLGIPETWTANVPLNLFENYNEQERIRVEDRQEVTRDILNDGLIRTPIWFEGSMLEYMNHDIVQTVGEITFHPGIHRESADLSKGYVLLKRYKVGIDSFAVGIRIKYTEFNHDEVLFSNSRAKDPNFNGFNAILTKGGVTFRIGNGRYGQKFDFDFEHKPNEWFSFIVSIDRDNQKISAFFNYELITEYAINEEFRTSTLDSLDFGIGMDGMEEYPYHLEALLSELYIFRIAVNEADMIKIKEQYD